MPTQYYTIQLCHLDIEQYPIIKLISISSGKFKNIHTKQDKDLMSVRSHFAVKCN